MSEAAKNQKILSASNQFYTIVPQNFGAHGMSERKEIVTVSMQPTFLCICFFLCMSCIPGMPGMQIMQYCAVCLCSSLVGLPACFNSVV